MQPEPISNRTAALLSGAMIALAIAVLAATYVLLTEEPRTTSIQIQPPLPTETMPPTPTPAPIQVYVLGAVATDAARISLPPDSRVGDAIDAVGGALPDADLRRVNLAARLVDGQMIVVPSSSAAGGMDADENIESVGPEEVPLPTDAAPPQGSSVAQRIDINTADSDELQAINGIGPALAQRIIDYRDANGPFTSVDDLINVSGIGPATLENMRPFITVN